MREDHGVIIGLPIMEEVESGVGGCGTAAIPGTQSSVGKIKC